ncbi:MAG TPA: hypothetical protein VG206_22780 [Terriglobia bacterium]|jgi:hypothetical protein|nr:hypothetical protein [Terriglobia bacterium]
MPQTALPPAELFQKFIRAEEAIEDLRDAFEDYLIAQNPRLLRKLRKARREDLSDKTRPFSEFVRELGL